MTLSIIAAGTLIDRGPAHAAATTRWVKGRVACASVDPAWKTLAVRGVWVESKSWVDAGGNNYGNGGAEFAELTQIDNQPWLYDFRVKITTPTANDQVRLKVGCGGTTKKWRTTNRTGWHALGTKNKFLHTTCKAKDGANGRRCVGWAGDTVLIGMPLQNGKWSSSDTNPKWHPGWGDWATDIFADSKKPQDRPVKAFAFGRRGQTVTVRFQSNTNLACKTKNGASKSGGRIVNVAVYRGGAPDENGIWSGGTKEATIKYVHLTDVPSFSAGEDVRGKRIGRTKWFGSASLWLAGSATSSKPDCYATSDVLGTHVHIGVDNHGGYSCYWPLALSTSPRLGSTVAKVGTTTATSDHEKCAN